MPEYNSSILRALRQCIYLNRLGTGVYLNRLLIEHMVYNVMRTAVGYHDIKI